MDSVIPRKRDKDLVVRPHGDEILVLDQHTGAAHCLPAEIARVWDACTGGTTLAEIASVAGVDEGIAESAVDQLILLDLLESGAGFDRRKFLRRSAVVGTGVAALPVIESVVAAPAWAAGSPLITYTYQCSGTNGRIKAITVDVTGLTINAHYIITVTVGPTPPGSVVSGQSWMSQPTNANANNQGDITNQNVSLTLPPGAVPDTTPTPVYIEVQDQAAPQAVVATLRTTAGPCDCADTICPVSAPQLRGRAHPRRGRTVSATPSSATSDTAPATPSGTAPSPAPVTPSGSPTAPASSSPAAHHTNRHRRRSS